MLITKKFTFDSAHKLNDYQGKCKNLHGHTYTLNITVEGEIDQATGMVIDFYKLNEIVKSKVVNLLDHTYLNDIIKQPTAENISVWAWGQLKNDINIYKIELWETPNSFVEYYGK
jgi:6-pyruvoyltetrahydropterin/6-carboxytetrahydropterin synthase